MCGIAGIVAITSQGVMEAHLTAMLDAIRSRGPDDQGTWIDPQRGLGLGHGRLSIIDTSHAGHEPMQSSCGRYWIVFNGEIYNFRKIRAELVQRGHSFAGHCDAEVLTEAVSEWGVTNAIARLNGMFAFAVFDLAEERLWLARDRLGEKPLYLGWSKTRFLFASEISAFETIKDFDRTICREALSQYLRYTYVPSPYSIYRNAAKLPAGHVLSISLAELRLTPPLEDLLAKAESYWSPTEAWRTAQGQKLPDDQPGLIDLLDERLGQTVSSRMISDVPLGAFLSGGIDSSLVVALMQKTGGAPVKTFSIGYEDSSRNEADDARKVAAHIGTDHTELYLQPEDVQEVIPKLASIYSEPFADSSQLPTFIVSQLARRKVTVALSGDGGDEVFGGYNRHLWAPRIWRKSRRIPRSVRLAAGKILRFPSPVAWDSFFERFGSILPKEFRVRTPGDKIYKFCRALGAESKEQYYEALASFWTLADGISPAAVRPQRFGARGRLWVDDASFSENMMLWDMQEYLPDDILVKVDRASMAVSLEVRAPFLDHELVEFALRIPLASKIREGVSKWALRQVLYRYVPRQLVERPKMGFGVPIYDWLRGSLREWVNDLLSPATLASQDYFLPAAVQRKLDEHMAGTHNWQGHLWSVLMFQSWLNSRAD